MNRKCLVYFQNIECGLLSELDDEFKFEYSKEWINNPEAMPVSLTLPLREEPFSSNILFPFFDGLIPEGYLLEIAINHYKLKENDRMGLLLKVCSDCIGAVSVKEVLE